jgi:hypothetical protein
VSAVRTDQPVTMPVAGEVNGKLESPLDAPAWTPNPAPPWLATIRLFRTMPAE